ncbi:MAG TPA: hypothetical protein VMD99_10985 [Terriglobales bacterium]|nr:hypothetical protein [Terriglobales bacterium]
MTKQTAKHIAVATALLGLVTASLAGAQVRAIKRLTGKRAGSSASQAPIRALITPGAPSYTFTLLNYPGQLVTEATCINKGATTSKTAIVGGYGSNDDFTQAGFLAKLSGAKTVTETYYSVSYPHEPMQQDATCINDLGQIVGTYLDSSGFNNGYGWFGGKFTPLEVPFAGATGTLPFGINNSGEVVGAWFDSDGNAHGFTLIGSTYTSFDYPGGTQTEFGDVNSAGDIVGTCYDASGVGIGFLLSGGTFTPIEYSGAVETLVEGINDSGVIVGNYCTTSECEADLAGVQNFLWSGGVYTPISILPGEVSAIAYDINNNGVLVGDYQDGAGVVGSFLATPRT